MFKKKIIGIGSNSVLGEGGGGAGNCQNAISGPKRLVSSQMDYRRRGIEIQRLVVVASVQIYAPPT